MGEPALPGSDAAPEPAGAEESAPELSQLKKLLFRPEQARIEALQAQCEAFAQKIGDDSRFELTTAQILAGALRKAEVAQHRELSSAIAPVVVAAIRNEIANSRDMMVEALYPITGRLVAASVANAFRELTQSLQQRIDALLSTQIWKLRMRAWLTGRPLSEILLEAAQKPRVLRLLALERDSGRLLASFHAEPGAVPDASEELVSGLIAAISQFSAQAFAGEHGELRQLDMGSSRILLRASTKTLVAAEFSGAPDAAQEQRMDRALYDLIESRAENPDAARLAAIAEGFAEPLQRPQPSRTSQMLLIGGVVALLAALLYVPARDHFRSRRIEAAFAQARDAQNLGAWPLTLTVDHSGGHVLVRGLVPPQTDMAAISSELTPAAAPYDVALTVERIASAESAGEAMARLAAADKARAELFARMESAEHKNAVFAQNLMALDSRQYTPAAYLARLARDSVLVFEDNADFENPEVAKALISSLAAALKADGGALRVVGYSDSTGNPAKNTKLSLERAQAVVKLLVEAGAPPERLFAVGRGDEDAQFDNLGPDRKRNRRVAFEPIPAKPEKVGPRELGPGEGAP